ncbi:MAG: hypothetical protein JXR83_08200 [Deltaproteobacteria bacterium]|nr:hypothetical protein [Deltaproteobacteria bacterium]
MRSRLVVGLALAAALGQGCQPPTPATPCDQRHPCGAGYECDTVRGYCRPTDQDAGSQSGDAPIVDASGRERPDSGHADRVHLDVGVDHLHLDNAGSTDLGGHIDAVVGTDRFDVDAAPVDAAIGTDRSGPTDAAASIDAAASTDAHAADAGTGDASTPPWLLRFVFTGPTTFDPSLLLQPGLLTPHWTFADGCTATGAAISHSVTAEGQQWVELAPFELGPEVWNVNASSDALTSFPDGLERLVDLQALDLNSNQIAGSIPDVIGLLTSLITLYLHNNRLSGEIPTAIGSLHNLQYLALYGNELTGSLPNELRSLSRLRVLSLSSNRLSGPLPRVVGSLASLRELRVDHNQLSDALPIELADLTQLQLLFLHDNALTGVEPNALGQLHNIQSIRLDNNALDPAAADQIVAEIWTARAGYLYPTPALDISGSNAAPSGVWTDPTVIPGETRSNGDWIWDGNRQCHAPMTGKAMAYDLERDVCGEGFKRWDVTCTP